MTNFTLTPAYGRDYKTKAQVLADFEAGKDFENATVFGAGAGGAYINRADVLTAAPARVTIRYAKLRKVVVTEVK